MSALSARLRRRHRRGDERFTPAAATLALAGLGGVAAGMGQAQAQSRAKRSVGGQAERGAKLLGAAEALLEAIGAVMSADDRIVYEQGVASARAQLSEEVFEKAWAEGRAMSMEKAVEYALEEG